MEKFLKNNIFCLYKKKGWIVAFGLLTGYQGKE